MPTNYFTLLIFLWIQISYSVSFSQPDKEFEMNRDSVYRYQGIIPPLEFKYNFDEIFSKSLFTELPDEILFDNNPSTIWLRTELLISNNASTESGEVNTFFTAPLYQQYLRDSEFDMVKYILGTVQTGAVAYMAYKHIKKYGFWK